MNLFKVLASGKNRFKEEQASVIIAWLLNPYMDHGLGFTFLTKFLHKSVPDIFQKLEDKLQPTLRSSRDHDYLNFRTDIEHSVSGSYIDIVLLIDKYIISIENKINSDSASDEKQLIAQYKGLKDKYKDEEIAIIFLVPGGEKESPKIAKEFNALKEQAPDVGKMIDWDDIREIIQKILDEEHKGDLSPINEYLRHTLKSLSCFIKDNFIGFDYETFSTSGNMNPDAIGRKKFTEIKQNQNNIKYVGVNKGIVGLLSLTKETLENHEWQYTDKSAAPNSNWLETKLFLELYGYIKENKYDNLDWMKEKKLKLPSRVIYKIAKNSPPFFIGIKRGVNGLSDMDSDKIAEQSWQVDSSLEPITTNWIPKEKFLEIIERKKVF